MHGKFNNNNIPVSQQRFNEVVVERNMFENHKETVSCVVVNFELTTKTNLNNVLIYCVNLKSLH